MSFGPKTDIHRSVQIFKCGGLLGWSLGKNQCWGGYGKGLCPVPQFFIF